MLLEYVGCCSGTHGYDAVVLRPRVLPKAALTFVVRCGYLDPGMVVHEIKAVDVARGQKGENKVL